MRWTVRRSDVFCGSREAFGEPCVISAGEPIAEFNGGRIKRCQYHAALIGHEFDAAARQEVALERARLDADDAYRARLQAARQVEAETRRASRPPLSARRDRARQVVGDGAPARSPAPATRPADQLRLPTGDRDE